MTDQQAYTDRNGDKMTLYGDRVGGGVLDIYAPRSVVIPAAELLAMIDRAAPEAMRAYLRETAPEVIADLYRPAPDAAEHFDYLDAYLRETAPEADSPEDVDERPGRDDPTERAQIDRAWAMEHAAAVLGRLVAATGAESGELPVTGYASWILTGSTETLDR